MPDPISPTTLIDGTIPRYERERCEVLYDYAQYLLDERFPVESARYRVQDVDPEWVAARQALDFLRIRFVRGEAQGIDLEWVAEVEDDIVSFINEWLPKGLVCVVGEPGPGDVIITDIDEVEL